jgi:hypothetical protein
MCLKSNQLTRSKKAAKRIRFGSKRKVPHQFSTRGYSLAKVGSGNGFQGFRFLRPERGLFFAGIPQLLQLRQFKNPFCFIPLQTVFGYEAYAYLRGIVGKAIGQK